ncbi:GDSL esterase/lipase At5g14450-like [Gastrolobium bilobum]|uniref:GDSL esterase/lipase At5g14450-like n=1 Tax=Gastrolobium bilobum TaxID=150636 RepID=UPI002AB111EB|nr:GDSL esterase/lipase At5g14450-like [Gastrolobium bilobum]
MAPLRKFAAVVLLSWFVLSLSLFLSTRAEELKSSKPCDFTAIFNFGDSYSDTGCMSSAFYPAVLPYGETFFNDPAGRASDGRLIIDFIAKHLGFPYLSAYINSIGTSYRHGANFAAGASTIRRQNKTFFDGGSPFTLEIQIAQFNQFKARTGKFFTQAKKNSYRKHFPGPEDFAKAIYTLDIGINDIADALQNVGKEDSQAVILDIVEYFSNQVQNLYGLGARTIWIHNAGPIGCLPVSMPMHNAYNITLVPGFLDQNGCVNYPNDMAKEFNKELKKIVVKLRATLPDASLTYVDTFSAKYELISNAKKEGFVDPSKICCGYHENGNHVSCGNKAMINGKEIFAGSCEDPSKYIFWDGVHYTEAANRWIANRIINGSFSDPPVPIIHSCHKSLA